MRLAPPARPHSGRRPFRRPRLRLERLEDRTVPAVVIWDGGPTGNGTNWLDAANWRDTNGNDVLPGAGDDVTLTSSGSSPTIVVGGSTAVRSITSTRNIQITAGTLAVGATANKFAALILDGGTLSPADGAAFVGGTITGPGVFTNAAGRTLAATNTDFDATVLNSGTLVVHGTVRFNGGVAAPAGAVLRVQGDAANGAANIVFPGGFTNSGTLELTSFLAANSATVTVNGGTLTNASGATFGVLTGAGGSRSVVLAGTGAFNNQGVLNVATSFTAMQSISASTSTSGTVTIDPAATFTVNGNGTTFNYQGGTIAGGGTLNLTNNLVVSIAYGTTLTNSSALTVSATNTTFIGPGTLVNTAGATLNLRDDTVSAPVVNHGTMIVRATVLLNGGVITTTGSTTRVLGDSAVGAASLIVVAGGLNNAGTFEMTSTGTANSASLTVTGGSFTNAGGGTVSILAGAGGTRSITLNSSQFVNQAAFNLTGTNLSVQGTLTNAVGGTLTLGAGTTLTPGLLNNGVIAGTGTIVGPFFGSGTVSPGLSAPGRLTINGNASFGGFFAELNGTTAGTLHDQLTVNGAVSFSGPLTTSGLLTATLGYTPAAGDVLRIIDNDGTDPVTGTFAGLPQGATVTIGGSQFTISYTGGTGNDVTLSFVGPPSVVSGVLINGGAAQRSMVTSLSVAFNQVVNLPANVADAFTLTPAAAQAIASSGFNDASGLNSNPTANAPYNVNNVSINGQGAGESGWLAPWSFAATAPVVVNAGQFEGDGTLFLQGTSAAQRVLQLPMAGITSIQIILKIPSAATSGDGLNLYIRQQANRQVGPNWQASGDGHFRVVDDNEDGTGNLLDTGFLWTPGTYQAIRIDVNTVTRTWDFFVDGVKFNAPHPLGYRDAPTFLDEIDIGNFIGGPNGAFVDSVTVTRRDLVTIGSASAATVGGVTVVTLTGFSGPQTSAGSLQDGSYTLTALATQITTAGGQQLDGNGDGTPGDNYVLTDSGQPGGLFRFYGDINGDRFVNGADFALFRSAFGTSLGDPAYNAGFDLNGDGFVNGADFAAFRTNFGLSI